MYKITLRLFTAMLIAANLTCSCSLSEEIFNKGTLTFSIDIISDSADGTKSSITASDNLVKTLDLFIFDANSGLQMKHCSFTGVETFKAGGIAKGRDYIVYALANHTGCNPLSLADAKNLSVATDNTASINSNGLPMAGITESFTFDDYTGTVSVPLTRLMSKIVLSVNTGNLTGSFKIKDILLCNAPKAVFPFRDTSSAESGTVSPGDRATKIDILRLNYGSSIVLLSGENMQGVLLPGNTDPWKKVPENIQKDEDCCTYISVIGDYNNHGLSISDICYKMYLGENSTDDFNLQRNCIYNLTLTLSDESAVLASSWKVERGVTQDCRRLLFDISADTLLQYSSSKRKISCYPENFDYDIIEGEGFEEAGLSWSIDGNGNICVSSQGISGKSSTGRLFAKSWDRGCCGWCDFTVMNWDTIVSINNGMPLKIWRGDTVSFSATLFYENNRSKTDITNTAVWTCSGDAGRLLGTTGDGTPMRFVGTRDGISLLTASHLGRSASVEAVVRSEKEVLLLPKDTTIHVGDSLTLRAYVIFNNGDTLQVNSEFDFLVKGVGYLRKSRFSATVQAIKAGQSGGYAILKRNRRLTDSSSILIVE